MRMLLSVCCLLCASSVLADDFQPTAQDQIVPEGAKLELLWNEGDFTEGPTLAKDGSILFSDIGNRIMRFDPESGQTTVFREPSGRANGLIFTPDGKSLVSSGVEEFRVWDVVTGRLERRFPGMGIRLHFRPDGKQLVSTGTVISAWDFESGKELHPPEGPTRAMNSPAVARNETSSRIGGPSSL